MVEYWKARSSTVLTHPEASERIGIHGWALLCKLNPGLDDMLVYVQNKALGYIEPPPLIEGFKAVTKQENTNRMRIHVRPDDNGLLIFPGTITEVTRSFSEEVEGARVDKTEPVEAKLTVESVSNDYSYTRIELPEDFEGIVNVKYDR